MSQGPAYQVLVFVCQVLVFGALAAWWLRGTRPGRDVCKAAMWLWWTPERRRAARARYAWNSWLHQINYWADVKRHHDAGTRQHEMAQDCINALRKIRPPNPYPCPYTAFTCSEPGCASHPRSTS